MKHINRTKDNVNTLLNNDLKYPNECFFFNCISLSYVTLKPIFSLNLIQDGLFSVLMYVKSYL